MQALFLFALLAPALVDCGRFENQIENKDEVEVEGKCTATDCTSFDEGKCSCLDYVDSRELEERLKGITQDTVMRVRKVQDKLEPGTGFFDKLWWGSSLGNAQQKLLLLEEGSLKVPALQAYLNAPLQSLPGADVPAGAWPIMVEIWDEDYGMSRQDFLGETGVGFQMGVQTYTRELRTNSYQNAVDPKGATVHFTTSVTTSEPFECEVDGERMQCTKYTVAVNCIKAEGLPNADTGIYNPLTKTKDVTDAYCKVRLNKHPGTPSQTFKTDVVSNSLNPSFGHDTFTSEIQVPYIEETSAEAESVPFTMDQLSLSEQVTASLQYLASEVFLKTDKCTNKASGVRALCKMVEQGGAMGVDKKALDELMSTGNPVVQNMAAHLSTSATSLMQTGSTDEAEEDEEFRSRSGKGGMAAVRAGRRAAQRPGGGGGGSMGGGGGGGGFFVILITFFILLAFI